MTDDVDLRIYVSLHAHCAWTARWSTEMLGCLREKASTGEIFPMNWQFTIDLSVGISLNIITMRDENARLSKVVLFI